MFAYHSLYEVSFPNGQTEELTSTMIAVNMQSQVDSDGHQCQVMKGISDNSADVSALKRINGFIRSYGWNLHAKKTTRGWKLEV